MIALYFKTWRDHWKTAIAWSITLIALISIQMSIYPSISKNKSSLEQFLNSYPEAIRKIFRMQDYTSGPGFLSTELYSMMVPLVLIAVGATWGASATAEEEDEGTADLLLTLPISRVRILLSKIAATVSVISILGLLAMANILILKNIVHLEIGTGKLISGTISSISLATFFTAIAFLAGAMSRHKGFAVGIVTGIALITLLIYSLAALVENFDSILPYNAMQWALGNNPLFNGVDESGVMKLLLSSLALFIASILVFNNKDISTP